MTIIIPPNLSEYLTEFERQEIERLLSFMSLENLQIQEIWHLLDMVWDEMKLNNRKVKPKELQAYYSHPVWIINGLFIEHQPESLGHRIAISSWINKNYETARILDYGGGFGTLSRIIASENPKISIDVLEPYAHRFVIEMSKPYENLKFIQKVDYFEYDCVLVIDVLEHIFNPIEEISKLSNLIKVGGYIVVANHFYSSIKCHLPCTFYLRHSFEQVMKGFGFRMIGSCIGSHAEIYQKVDNLSINSQGILWIEIRAKINAFLVNLINLWQSFSKYTERQIKRLKRKIKSILMYTSPH